MPRPPIALLLALLALALAGCGEDDPSPAPEPDRGAPEATAPARPNLLVVMTDDQTAASFNPEVMPQATSFFADGGTTFGEAISVPPLCCPARAGFLTGQYAHNHGVLGNEPGYPDLRDPGATLPVALQAAGYRTGMIGKYLNNYELVGGEQPAPGFDRWFATLGYAGYYDYTVSDDGEPRHYGDDLSDYSTSVYFRQAGKFAASAAADDEPFFLWLAPNAPHTAEPGAGSCTGRFAQPPDEAAYEEFADAPLPESDAFDEADVTDKPRWAKGSDPLDEADRAEIETAYRCALASVRAVDDGFGELVSKLEGEGLLEDTVVVFVSDNGLLNGEHRIFDDKRLPLEPALRVPLAIRLPPSLGADAPTESGALASTVDLAPTLLDYAGAKPCDADGRCWRMDGRSLRPLLAGDEDRWPRDRGLPIELDDGYAYTAIRTPDYLYSEMTADRGGPLPRPIPELYDLRADPEELENLARSKDPEMEALRTELAERLDRLRPLRGDRGPGPEGRLGSSASRAGEGRVCGPLRGWRPTRPGRTHEFGRYTPKSMRFRPRPLEKSRRRCPAPGHGGVVGGEVPPTLTQAGMRTPSDGHQSRPCPPKGGGASPPAAPRPRRPG